jgi:hypothetical protein
MVKPELLQIKYQQIFHKFNTCFIAAWKNAGYPMVAQAWGIQGRGDQLDCATENKIVLNITADDKFLTADYFELPSFIEGIRTVV